MARPLAYGYVSVPPGAPDDQAQRWQREIATFVDSEGHDLAGVFTDVRGSGAPAFEAMSRALGVGAVTEVVVPCLDHLEHVPGFGPGRRPAALLATCTPPSSRSRSLSGAARR